LSQVLFQRATRAGLIAPELHPIPRSSWGNRDAINDVHPPDQTHPSLLTFRASASRTALNIKRLGNCSAIFRKLDHHLLVQPDVHRGSIFRIARVVQLLGQLLASSKAAVQLEKLHQIYNRVPPIEFLLIAGEIFENPFDINMNMGCSRRSRGLRAACAGRGGTSGRWTLCLAAAGGCT
jgi:hypothetical protein